MKKILKIFIVFLSLISLNSCSKLTVNGLRFLSRNVINDRDKFLKNIVYIHGLVETIDAKKGYTLKLYEYKGVKFYNYRKKESKNVLIYFHGGAFVIDTIKGLYFKMNEQILDKSPQNYEILMVDLKGKKYPDQSVELEKVLEYAFSKYDKVVVAGDSSGGNVVLSTLLKRRDENMKLPQGIFLLSPWTDLTNNAPSRRFNFKKDALFGEAYPKLLVDNPYIEDVKNRKDPYVSPIYGNYKNFPKTLIQYGSDEILSDDSKFVYNAMKTSGVDVKLEEYEGMIHVFQLFPMLDKRDEALKNISNFLGEIYK